MNQLMSAGTSSATGVAEAVLEPMHTAGEGRRSVIRHVRRAAAWTLTGLSWCRYRCRSLLPARCDDAAADPTFNESVSAVRVGSPTRQGVRSMTGANDMERRDDDADASTDAQAQESVDRLAAQLEAMIDLEVAAAMADPQADGTKSEYRTKEQRWNAAANDVRNIVRLMHQSLEDGETTTNRARDPRQAGGGVR